MEKAVAVLFGGNSSEYEVSLMSAAAVIRHLDTRKYKPILIGITRQGEWLRYTGSPDRIEDGTWFSDKSCVPAAVSPSPKVHGVLVLHNHGLEPIWIDVAFPILHGKLGEDGTVQGLLDLSGIPFVGCGTLSSALCMDKDISHVVARAAGIQTPPHVVIRRQDDGRAKIEQADTLGYPLFVKPARAGSSFGITMVTEKETMPEALRFAFEYDNKVVIEQCVDGFEVGCAVLGNDVPIVGEVDEIELKQGFFDYTEKYTLKTAQIHVPARIDAKTADKVKKTALALYRALGCRGFARVDMFLRPTGEIIFNEVNTIPGLTPHSRYPNMLQGAGLSFKAMVDRLIELATEDGRD